MQTPEDRAIRVIQNNKYMVLATADSDGPWAAALAFVIVGRSELAFISQRSSRHGSAIGKSSAVGGVIFDSQAEAADVESVQFSGTCVDVGDDEDAIRRVLAAGGACDGSAVSYEEVKKIQSDPEKGVYVTTLQELYVLDQAAWQKQQIDARETVDKEAVFSWIDSTRA